MNDEVIEGIKIIMDNESELIKQNDRIIALLEVLVERRV
jgi:hypothetical protein